jgi:8-amino-7-oxononanoate synthase
MPSNSALEERLRSRLSRLGRDGLLRSLRCPSGIDLSSNDYLCLAADPRIKRRMAEAVCSQGSGSTGSRLLRGEREGFAAIERRFAMFKKTEKSLYFSSGYLANIGVLSALAEAGDTIFSDALNHASLIDGARLSKARRVIFPHNDAAALAALLRNAAGPGQRFVVVESLFSMEGDFAPLADYAELCRETGAALIVDDAHAIGVWGERGAGLSSNGVFLSVNSAGKALGVAGAFVAGPSWAIDCLIQQARPFVFSTAPPPAVAAAIDASLDVIEAEPERRVQLMHRAGYLRQRLGLAGNSQIIALILGSNERAVEVADKLQRAGFDVRAIRPPTVPAGTARLRISVNAGLSEEILDSFVDALCRASS